MWLLTGKASFRYERKAYMDVVIYNIATFMYNFYSYATLRTSKFISLIGCATFMC